MDVTFSYSLDNKGLAIIRASDSRLPILVVTRMEDGQAENLDEAKDDGKTKESSCIASRLNVIRSANALVEKLAAAPPAGLPATDHLLFFTSSRLPRSRDFTDPPPVSGLVRSIVAIKTQYWRVRTGPDPYDVSEFVRAYEGVMVSAGAGDSTHSDSWLISQLDFDRRIELTDIALRHPLAARRLDAALGRLFPKTFAPIRAPALTR